MVLGWLGSLPPVMVSRPSTSAPVSQNDWIAVQRGGPESVCQDHRTGGIIHRDGIGRSPERQVGVHGEQARDENAKFGSRVARAAHAAKTPHARTGIAQVNRSEGITPAEQGYTGSGDIEHVCDRSERRAGCQSLRQRESSGDSAAIEREVDGIRFRRYGKDEGGG